MEITEPNSYIVHGELWVAQQPEQPQDVRQERPIMKHIKFEIIPGFTTQDEADTKAQQIGNRHRT